jgi:hypothetical protein
MVDLFHKSSFLPGWASGTNYSNSVVIFGVRDNENLLIRRHTNGYKALFIIRVIFALKSSRKRVCKDCGASWKLMPCLRRLVSALLGSHVISTESVYAAPEFAAPA